MEVVRGLTIGDGSVTPQKIYLSVDIDKICYITLPNGALLTSAGGIIDYNYTGAGGRVLLVVPKNTMSISISGSVFKGTIKTNIDATLNIGSFSFVSSITGFGINKLYCSGAEYLSTVKIPKAVVLSADGCGFTAQVIGDFLIDAVANNMFADGLIITSGGTSANSADINTYLISQGTTLAAVLTQLATWTITLKA